MVKVLLAVLLTASASAVAQSPPAPNAAPAAPLANPDGSPAVAPGSPADARIDAIEHELETRFENKLEEAKAAMREEMRAQLATQQAQDNPDDTYTAPRQHLDVLVPHGYLRVRPDLFNKFDLNREPDPTGRYLFPRAPGSTTQRTEAGANMRFRFEPTLNISEEVRIMTQVDVLDNLVLGSTPDTGFANGSQNFDLFSNTTSVPRAGINSYTNSIEVKRVWGEVNTPVGILRFGRMGSQFGLGILHNDGNCLNCDHGETVDRIQFVIEPVAGFFITPMFDFNVEGPTSYSANTAANASVLSGLTGANINTTSSGQPFDLNNSDDAHSFVLAAARRDTDAQIAARLEQGLSVFNYGFHFTYRFQHDDSAGYYQALAQGTAAANPNQVVFRGGQLYIPDIWAKFQKGHLRIEAEAAGVFGYINSRAGDTALGSTSTINPSTDPGYNQALNIVQFGGVLQGEYRMLNENLHINLELGFASGDKAPGLGNYPGRAGSGTGLNAGNTTTGDIDGRQYNCSTGGGCSDNSIRNFRFNQDYRIDLILWREILGGLTDAFYVRPSASYNIGEGFSVYAAVIYSRTIYAQSSPNGTDPNLGIEIDAGAQYMSQDGFFAGVTYGILFPLKGLTDSLAANPNKLDDAQAVRGYFGIKF